MTNDELIAAAAEYRSWDPTADACIYAGSATCDQWQCHVPQIVAVAWPHMSVAMRAVVFLTAMQVVLQR